MKKRIDFISELPHVTQIIKIRVPKYLTMKSNYEFKLNSEGICEVPMARLNPGHIIKDSAGNYFVVSAIRMYHFRIVTFRALYSTYSKTMKFPIKSEMNLKLRYA